jgi:hypothetical protein
LDELRNYVSLDIWERVQRLNIAQKAAENPGAGGALVGAGVGLGVGQQIGAAMNPEMAEMQRQLAQQQMLMQQMMLNNMQGQNAPAAADPATASPQTKAEVEALIDQLDARFARGEISEAAYNRLVEKWQKRLDEMA